MDRFMPKISKGIPAEELEDAETERSKRQDVEHLRRTLYWIDVDWYVETGEYRRLPEWEKS